MRQIFVSTILLSHFSAIGAFSVFGNICQSPRCVSSQPVCIFRQNIPIVRRIGKDHTIKCSNSAGDLSEEDQERGKKLADAWIRQDKALECSRLLQGKSLFLVGAMSPKVKSIATLLSKRLGNYRFLDVMEIVAAATGNANADPTSSLKLIQDLGEDKFRGLEEAVMDQLQSMARCVICTVDSKTLTTPMNWIRMQQGIIVYIQSDDLEGAAAQPADPDTLGLATVHVDVSTHDAADDEVMKIVKKIAYELRQQNQQR